MNRTGRTFWGSVLATVKWQAEDGSSEARDLRPLVLRRLLCRLPAPLRVTANHVFVVVLLSLCLCERKEGKKEKRETTFDGGSLGSRIDEERSQLR